MSEVQYLELADYLIIAEAVVGRHCAVKVDLACSALAAPSASFAGIEFYPQFGKKAAVLCWHLVKSHALVDGNKRVGYLCLVEFAERNGYEWTPPPEDGPEGDNTVWMINHVAESGDDVLPEFAAWIQSRIESPTGE